MTQEIKSLVNLELLRNVGPRVFISDISKKNMETYSVELGVQKPMLIYDDHHKKQFLRFIKFKSIYEFEVQQERKTIEIDKKQLYEATLKHFKLLNLKGEKAVLECVYDKLIAIPLIRTSLTQIYDVVSKIVRDKIISAEAIRKHHKGERYLQYISFLEQLDIVRTDMKGNVIEGNIPIWIKKEIDDPDKMIAKLFGYTIREGKSYLISQLKIYGLSPFVPIINAYYQMASTIGHPIKTTIEQFRRFFEQQYYPIDENKFQNDIAQLCDANILHRKDNYVTGDREVLNKIMPLLHFG